jgi:hypothetical protein
VVSATVTDRFDKMATVGVQSVKMQNKTLYYANVKKPSVCGVE